MQCEYIAEYCTERVIVPSPINRFHYEFEKPVKETKISNRKHYGNISVVIL